MRYLSGNTTDGRSFLACIITTTRMGYEKDRVYPLSPRGILGVYPVFIDLAALFTAYSLSLDSATLMAARPSMATMPLSGTVTVILPSASVVPRDSPVTGSITFALARGE